MQFNIKQIRNAQFVHLKLKSKYHTKSCFSFYAYDTCHIQLFSHAYDFQKRILMRQNFYNIWVKFRILIPTPIVYNDWMTPNNFIIILTGVTVEPHNYFNETIGISISIKRKLHAYIIHYNRIFIIVIVDKYKMYESIVIETWENWRKWATHIM